VVAGLKLHLSSYIMTAREQEIHSYDYVNRPYAQVRDTLNEDPLAVFRSATQGAASRAHSVAAELRVDIGGIRVEADIKITLKSAEEVYSQAKGTRVTRLQLEWEGAGKPWLFPLMKAEISIYPLTATETQLDFAGVYEPPMGLLGGAANALIGHQIARASVHRFVSEVADYLRRQSPAVAARRP
jgi:hypothetical protein